MRNADAADFERQLARDRHRFIREAWAERRKRSAHLMALPAFLCAGALVTLIPLLGEARSSGRATVIAVACLGGVVGSSLHSLASLLATATARPSSPDELPPASSLLVALFRVPLGAASGFAASAVAVLVSEDLHRSFRPQALFFAALATSFFLTSVVAIRETRVVAASDHVG